MQSNSVCFKRLQKDFENIQKHPLIGCSASPLPNDLTLWHCNIVVPLKIDNKTEELPIHLLIEFTEKYPIEPPDVGFCTEFPYRMGLSLTARSGRIKGLYELCLNILGNLSKVHTEWSSQVGEGWSAGMSVSTLLVNLQSILLDLDQQLSIQEKKKLVEKLQNFKMEIKDGNWSVQHTAHKPWPELPKQQEEKQEKQGKCKLEVYKAMLVNEKAQIDDFLIKKAKLNEDLQNEFYILVGGILERNNVVMDAEPSEEVKQNQKEEQKKEQLSKIKEEIFCYVSGMSFEDGILGFGIYKDRNLISTYAELLSYDQYKQGYRQSSNKSKFSNFLPAYICPGHAENSNNNWKIVTKNCMKSITELINMQGCTFKDAALWILPKLINSMIVEMKKNSKAQAIAFFEAMCSFWRTLRFFYTNTEGLQDQAVKMIKDFTNYEQERHKDINPDVGVVLAIATTVIDKINFSQFIDSYLDENFIRCVMWWNKGQNSKEKNNVFKQTQVSRELLLFQLLLINTIIGDSPKETEQQMDATYGKIPTKLEEFQQKLKQLKVKNWEDFFLATGCSKDFANGILANVDGWIANCIERSNKKGKKYQKR